MGTLLDIGGALIIRGLMYLTMLGITATLNDALYMKTALNNVQGELTSIAGTVESDFQKIGYNDTTSTFFLTMKPDSISFRGDIYNNDIIFVVTYSLSDTSALTSTANATDRLLYRRVRNTVTGIETLLVVGAGLTQFHVAYYNSAGTEETDPVLVSSVEVQLKTEHLNFTVSNKYPSAFWQRGFYPSNL